MAYTINHYITDWVEESRALMQPDKVLWIDGTETQLEELRREAYITGELIKLNQEKLPGCVLPPQRAQRRCPRRGTHVHLLQKGRGRRPHEQLDGRRTR